MELIDASQEELYMMDIFNEFISTHKFCLPTTNIMKRQAVVSFITFSSLLFSLLYLFKWFKLEFFDLHSAAILPKTGVAPLVTLARVLCDEGILSYDDVYRVSIALLPPRT